MAFGSRAALCRLLLRRSDRHPVACIDGGDLAAFDPQLVRRFMRAGLLVEREKLTDIGDVVFQSVGERTVAVSVDGDGDTVIAPADALQQFDLDFPRLCEAIRKANKLEGRIQAIDARVVCLGGLGKGSRRREFYLARALQARNAIDIALAVKGRAAGGAVIILTPTDRQLPIDVVRRLALDQITIAAISEILKEDAEEPFDLAIPQTMIATATAPADERLVIDTQGALATFDSREIELRPREFHVLSLLAIELTEQNGFVLRERISKTIREITESDANEEQVDKSISLLRDALVKAGELDANQRAKIIETKRKVGYRIVLPPEHVKIF